MTFQDTNPNQDQYQQTVFGGQNIPYFRDADSPSQARLNNANAAKIEQSLTWSKFYLFCSYTAVGVFIYFLGLVTGIIIQGFIAW